MVVNTDEYGVVIRIIDVIVHGLLPVQMDPLAKLFVIDAVIIAMIRLIGEDTTDADGLFPLPGDTMLVQILLKGLAIAVNQFSPTIYSLFSNTEYTVRVITSLEDCL